MERTPGRLGVVYPTFEEYPNRKEADELVIFQPSNADFSYTADDLMRFYADKSIAMLLLINPDNPSGNYISRADVLRLATWCEQRGIRFLVDESFVDFRSDAEDFTVRSLAGAYNNLLVVQSLTKFFAILGLRLGFAVAPPCLAEKLEAAKDPWNTNLLAQAAGVAALGDGEYQKRTLQWLESERDFLFRSLAAFEGIKAYPPTVNFIFLRLSPTWGSASAFCERMKEEGILLRDCSNYPGLDDTYIRVAVRKREENELLLEAFRRARGGRK